MYGYVFLGDVCLCICAVYIICCVVLCACITHETVCESLCVYACVSVLHVRVHVVRVPPRHHSCFASEMHSGFDDLRNHCTMNVRMRLEGKSPLPERVQANVDRITAIFVEARTK